ncbi:MAG: diguanylate cyclase [Verrucomicrobia bacterium]|nr:diguanylate cyclase [Verrucomicrobiota bacterium]
MMHETLVGAGQFLLIGGISFALLSLLTSIVRFQQLTHRLSGSDGEDIDPHDTFRMEIMKHMGSAHRTPAPFAILIAEVLGLAEFKEQHGEKTGDEMSAHLARACRENTRGADSLHKIGNNRIAILLHAERKSAQLAGSRIIDSLTRSPCRCTSGLTIRVPANVGVASFPENGEKVNALIRSATDALDADREKGIAGFTMAPVIKTDAEEEHEKIAEEPAPADQNRLLDELTGVLKPERVGTALQKYVARYRKDGLPVSILYVDIDNLDRYNKHYGMEAGDAVLRGMGRLLEESLRLDDLIARVEADEFVIGLGCSPEDALITAQRLSADVKKESFRLGNAMLKTTVCIGVAGAPSDGTNARVLFDAAFQALGEAKKRGRNICVRFHPVMRQQKERETRSDTF